MREKKQAGIWGALWNSEIQMGKIKQLVLDILESQESLDLEDGVVYNFPDHPAYPHTVAVFCNGQPKEESNADHEQQDT